MKKIIGLVGLGALLVTAGCQSERYQGGSYGGFRDEYPNYQTVSHYPRSQGGYYGGFRTEFPNYDWNSPSEGDHYWYR